MSVYEYALASDEDAGGILKIMEEDIAPGDLGLLYTRRDDPLKSFAGESRQTKVGVIRKDGEVIATIAAIPREMYINGRPRKVCYVTNMKRLCGSDEMLNWHEIFEKICRIIDCDIYFCSLIKGNDPVHNMLSKRRKYMPYTEAMTGYKTYVLSPKARVKGRCGAGEFMRAGSDDERELTEFLNRNGSRRNLFPTFDKLSDIGDIKADDFYLLKDGGCIVAAGALWDRTGVKQYVLKKCSGIYAILRRLNKLLDILGYITLPEDDSVVENAFISFLTVSNDDEGYLRRFLKEILKEAKDYRMLVIGTDVNNPKYKVLESIRAVSFESELNEVIMTGIDQKTPEAFDRTLIEAECALL